MNVQRQPIELEDFNPEPRGVDPQRAECDGSAIIGVLLTTQQLLRASLSGQFLSVFLCPTIGSWFL